MLWPSKLTLLFYIGNIMCLTSHCVKSLILAISLWEIKEKISKLWKIENCDITVNNNYYIIAIGKIVHFWGLFFKFYSTFLKFLLKHRSVNYQTQVYNISFYIVITINFAIPWVVGGVKIPWGSKYHMPLVQSNLVVSKVKGQMILLGKNGRMCP